MSDKSAVRRQVDAAAASAESRRFMRYLAVGALATLVHYALLVVAVEWGRWQAWPASGMAAVVGAQVAYVGNLRLTFSYAGAVARSWMRFQLTALFGAGTSMLVVALAVSSGLHYLLGQLLATGLVAALTYAVNRSWTFRSRPGPG